MSGNVIQFSKFAERMPSAEFSEKTEISEFSIKNIRKLMGAFNTGCSAGVFHHRIIENEKGHLNGFLYYGPYSKDPLFQVYVFKDNDEDIYVLHSFGKDGLLGIEYRIFDDLFYDLNQKIDILIKQPKNNKNTHLQLVL